MSTNTKIMQHNPFKNREKNHSRFIDNKNVTPISIREIYQTKPITMQELITRRINKTLCICLLFTIAVTFISYYIAMNYEAKLNALDREIVFINNENQDLQSDLDKYKSFSNVDEKVGEFKLLKKADKVIEVTAMNTTDINKPAQQVVQNKYNWALGY